MKRLEKATTYNKRGLDLRETEEVLKNRILKFWGFDRIVYKRSNKWLTPYGTTRSTEEIWDLMNFYNKPLPF